MHFFVYLSKVVMLDHLDQSCQMSHWKFCYLLNGKAILPLRRLFAGLHYHSFQLSPGVHRSLQDIFMVMTRWKMSFAINKKLALLTFQFFSTTVTNLLSTKFKCPKMITNALQCDYFHGSESIQCHKLTLFWYAQD